MKDVKTGEEALSGERDDELVVLMPIELEQVGGGAQFIGTNLSS
jgi:hypothetical protein